MSESKIAISKMKGIRKQLLAALDLLRHESHDGIYTSQWYSDSEVGHLFRQSDTLMTELVEEMPSWFSDFKRWETGTTIEVNDGRKTWPAYSRAQVQQLVRDTFQIITLFGESEKVAAAGTPAATAKPVLRTVFISHGQSLDWLKVQPYIEKDLKYRTEEFDQNSYVGDTVIEALEDLSAKCDSAVIVMTGDDKDEFGKPKARENVMHEIGWFQGCYKRRRVAVLHEAGVNIPTNLAGVIYIGYPKGNVEGSFVKLARHLKKLYD